MTSLITLPTDSDAFSEYRPSKNAHIDIISSTSGRRRDSAVNAQKDGPRVVKLTLKRPCSFSQTRLLLNRNSARPAELSLKERLSTLSSCIAPVLAGKPTAQSYHYLSSSCHQLVEFPNLQGPALYAKLREELERSVGQLAREWKASIMSKEVGWLERLMDGWKVWETRVVSDPSMTITI